MVFSSLTFLQCFLPLCLLAYFLVPQKWRNGTLFLFSLLFYAWGEPVYVVLMLFSTALDYTPSIPKLTQSDTNSAIFAPRCPRCRSTICPQV